MVQTDVTNHTPHDVIAAEGVVRHPIYIKLCGCYGDSELLSEWLVCWQSAVPLTQVLWRAWLQQRSWSISEVEGRRLLLPERNAAGQFLQRKPMSVFLHIKSPLRSTYCFRLKVLDSHTDTFLFRGKRIFSD